MSQSKSKFVAFLSQLEDLSAGRRFPFTVVLRDPLANSFISAPLGSFLPPELDAGLELSDFERTFEEVSSVIFADCFAHA